MFFDWSICFVESSVSASASRVSRVSSTGKTS